MDAWPETVDGATASGRWRGAIWARLRRVGTAGAVCLVLGGGAGATAAAQAAGPGPGYGYQLVPGDRPSVVALGTGEAVAPAESGRLQFVVRAVDPFALSGGEVPPMGPGQTPPLTEAQVRPVADALVAVGVPEEAVAIIVNPAFGGPFGPGAAQILVDLEGDELARAADLAEAATTAAGPYGLYIESIGAGFRIERCEELIAEARAAAAEDGRDRAETLAEALGVELGPLLLASEVPGYNDGSGFGCSAAPPVPGTSGIVYYPPFDPSAEPVVEAYVQLNLAYEIVGEAEATPEA